MSGLNSFGQALLQLEISRLRTRARTPPTLFTDRITLSLGDGNYHVAHLNLARADLHHLTKVLKKATLAHDHGSPVAELLPVIAGNHVARQDPIVV
jgi:hypothetical protein